MYFQDHTASGRDKIRIKLGSFGRKAVYFHYTGVLPWLDSGSNLNYLKSVSTSGELEGPLKFALEIDGSLLRVLL